MTAAASIWPGHRLLKQCGPHGLSAIFRVEIDGQLLGQVLHELRQALAEAAAPPAAAAGAEQGVQQQQAPSESASQLVAREAVVMVQLLHSLTGGAGAGVWHRCSVLTPSGSCGDTMQGSIACPHATLRHPTHAQARAGLV